MFRKQKLVIALSTLLGIDWEPITFSNLESLITPDNKTSFIDAFVEESISTVRGVKERDLTDEVT